jgi:hypothetical protein
MQEIVSLLELSLLKEAGVIGNDNYPTISQSWPVTVRQVIHQHRPSTMSEVWDKGHRHPAMPRDSNQ